LAGQRSSQLRSWLIDEAARAGLVGRGGAGYATWKKLLAAGTQADPILVVNAMEGEPASRKDRVLVTSSPHLVLDGAELVAAALNASRIIVCVAAEREDMAEAVKHAIRERSSEAGQISKIELRKLPGSYVAGEESALVAAVSGGSGRPLFRPDKAVPLRIGRVPALVQNAETLANLTLIARFGASWFTAIGSREAPGTRLVTVSGAVADTGVFEIATGTPIREILMLADPVAPIQAVLVGGYGGTWIGAEDLDTPFAPAELRELGASMGAGVLVALSTESCGVRETERITRFMAAESAGQCGPCLFGLPALADDLRLIADGSADRVTLHRLTDRSRQIDGRGACRHPDGVVRLVTSALAVFSSDIGMHLRGIQCREVISPGAGIASALDLGGKVAL